MGDDRAPVVALVPVRELGAGKSRLADHLGPHQRAALTAAMLADVAAALRQAPVHRVVVAASGAMAAAAARALRLDVVRDPPDVASLDASLRGVAGRVGAGAAALAVVMADLPRLSPADVAALLATDGQVVVAPTDDGGTGGLLRRPPGIIATAYGPDSATRHVRLGERAGARAITVELPGFRHDVDTWDDLVALRTGPVGPATSAFLDDLGPRLDPGRR